MTYLLAKYALVFLLSLISGILFGRWMMRRRFVDVSESYENLRDAATRPDAAQWSQLWNRLDALPEPKEADFSALNDRLNGLAYAIGNIPEPGPVNFAPVEGKLEALSKIVSAIPTPAAPKEVDLRPVTSKLDHLAAKIDALLVPKEVPPIDQRLGAIEAELGRLGRRLEVVPQARNAEDAGPATLKTPSHGNKDDLRLIFGVGPMLEELLNHHGIFYFWQIASWTDRDIAIMDERLDTFKGRIVRDNWVEQAEQLSGEPNAAQQPTEMRISA